jgi:hypothetical protein
MQGKNLAKVSELPAKKVALDDVALYMFPTLIDVPAANDPQLVNRVRDNVDNTPVPVSGSDVPAPIDSIYETHVFFRLRHDGLGRSNIPDMEFFEKNEDTIV